MPLAVATYDTPLDPFYMWQIANGAAMCVRMSAIITPAACDVNRQQLNADYRCTGCRGLYNQAFTPTARPSLVLVWDANEKTEPEPDTAPGSGSADTINAAFAALDEIIDSYYEEPEPADDFSDVTVDLDEEQLLALFPELASDEDDEAQPDFQRFTEYMTEAPRYAVYQGHCKKCGGHVENIREWHDDNVFHCFACGWRTGPEYQQNRALQAAGMVIV